MEQFFTWEYLVTFAGAMVATGLITQWLKNLLDKYLHLPTQGLAYCVALAVLVSGLFFTGGLSLSATALSMFNAVLIATATSGTIDAAKRVKGVKRIG